MRERENENQPEPVTLLVCLLVFHPVLTRHQHTRVISGVEESHLTDRDIGTEQKIQGH